MARLIEITQVRDAPPHLVIGVGDLLQFNAGGAVVRDGADVLEMLGPFRPAVIVGDGTPLSPEGMPNTVMFLARARGSAVIELVSGDLWQNPVRTVLNVVVEAPDAVR
jgi:hypothetical protein